MNNPIFNRLMVPSVDVLVDGKPVPAINWVKINDGRYDIPTLQAEFYSTTVPVAAITVTLGYAGSAKWQVFDGIITKTEIAKINGAYMVRASDKYMYAMNSARFSFTIQKAPILLLFKKLQTAAGASSVVFDSGADIVLRSFSFTGMGYQLIEKIKQIYKGYGIDVSKYAMFVRKADKALVFGHYLGSGTNGVYGFDIDDTLIFPDANTCRDMFVTYMQPGLTHSQSFLLNAVPCYTTKVSTVIVPAAFRQVIGYVGVANV